LTAQKLPLTQGTQHRSDEVPVLFGEAACLLTGYGHSPGDLDFDYYVHTQG